MNRKVLRALATFGCSCLFMAATLGAPLALASEAEPPAGAAQPSASATPEEPIEWFVDEERGQRYRIEKIPKAEYLYEWIEGRENFIQYQHGLIFEVVEHDDDWFWVKVWESVRRDPARNQKPAEQVEAERRAIADSYRADLETVDRIRLTPFGHGLPRSGHWRHGVDVADMDGDGHLDLVSGAPRKSTRPRPHVFLGDGAGGWRHWSEARFPPLAYDYGDAAAGDLDGDGVPDLVLGVHLRGILALVNGGGGGFHEWRSGIGFRHGDGSAGFASRAVELIDHDGDGRLDILALGEGPQALRPPSGGGAPEISSARGLLLLSNRGDGSWGARRADGGPLESGHFGDDLALADFNADGRVDVAVASRLLGVGNIVGLADGSGGWAFQDVLPLRPRAVIDAVAAADVDGDGRAELFVSYRNRDLDDVPRTGIDMLSPDGRLGWRRRPIASVEGRMGIYSLAVGNLDGDGGPDLVAVTGDGEVWLFLAEGGFFVREHSPELPSAAAGCRGYALRLADLNRDGLDEVVAGFAGESDAAGGSPGCYDGGSLHAWRPARSD